MRTELSHIGQNDSQMKPVSSSLTCADNMLPSQFHIDYGVTYSFRVNQNGELKITDLIKLPEYQAFNNMHILNDSLFIYYLPDRLKVVKFDLKNNMYLDDIQMKKDSHNESYFYKNRGTIAANDSFLVYSYFFKKQINIYRVNDFKFHKKITGDYKYSTPV